MIGGRRTVRRLVRVALFVGAASAALAAAGPDALVPFKDAAGAATDVSVAFVVDFGSLGPPVVGCVQVPSSDNGYAALAAFTAQRGEAAPIYNNAGLLCSIDDLPGNAPAACGAQVPGGYDYWSYWHGTTGSWVYADTGAFATVQNGDVEGWRYETGGQSNPGDPHPGPAPSYAGICGSAVSTVTPPPAATTTPPAPSATTPPATGAGGGTMVPKGSAGAGGGAAPAPTATGGKDSATTAPSSTAPLGSGGSTGTTPPGSGSGGSGPPVQSLRATPASEERPGTGGGAVPGLIGALLVVALAGGAVFGWRRRARTQ